MKILITGLHRSGTSVTAKLLSYSTGCSLLDDPEWAIFHPLMGAAYKIVPDYRRELDTSDLVKCPRLAECLNDVMADFPSTGVVFLIRDPRDIYCSIMEAQKSPHSSVSTMLDNSRFGKYTSAWEGFILSYNFYAQAALLAKTHSAARMFLLSYEKVCADAPATVSTIARYFSFEATNELPPEISKAQLGPLRNKTPSDPSIKGPGRWKKELDQQIAQHIWASCSNLYTSLLKQQQ